VKEKPTVGYPFLEAFPSDRFSKATKDVGVLYKYFSVFTGLHSGMNS
jgi:hypothetical protein